MAARRLLVVLVLAAACTGESSPPAASSVTPSSAGTVSEPASFGPSAEVLIAFHSDPAGRDDTYVIRRAVLTAGWLQGTLGSRRA